MLSLLTYSRLLLAGASVAAFLTAGAMTHRAGVTAERARLAPQIAEANRVAHVFASRERARAEADALAEVAALAVAAAERENDETLRIMRAELDASERIISGLENETHNAKAALGRRGCRPAVSRAAMRSLRALK